MTPEETTVRVMKLFKDEHLPCEEIDRSLQLPRGLSHDIIVEEWRVEKDRALKKKRRWSDGEE